MAQTWGKNDDRIVTQPVAGTDFYVMLVPNRSGVARVGTLIVQHVTMAVALVLRANQLTIFPASTKNDHSQRYFYYFVLSEGCNILGRTYPLISASWLTPVAGDSSMAISPDRSIVLGIMTALLK